MREENLAMDIDSVPSCPSPLLPLRLDTTPLSIILILSPKTITPQLHGIKSKQTNKLTVRN